MTDLRFSFHLSAAAMICLLMISGALYSQAFTVAIAVEDGSNQDMLRLGVDPSGSDSFDPGLDSLAPPAAPPGAFDARFDGVGDEYLTDVRDNSLSLKTFVMRYAAESGGGPIVVSWDRVLLDSLGSFRITDNVDGQQFSLDMSGTGSLSVSAHPSLATSLRIEVLINPAVGIGAPAGAGLPESPVLYQNYPNPFNPETRLAFYLPQAAPVRLRVFNLLGQEVARVADRHFGPGHHSLPFDGLGFPSGTYYYLVESGSFRAVRRMVLMK